MPFAFTVLPFDVPGATTLLDITKVSSFASAGIEAGAAGHWLFGADNPNMLDMAGAQPIQRTPSVVVTAGGTGWTGTPTVTASGWGGSVQPTFVAQVTSGAISSIVCTDPGIGCDTAGTIALAGGGGTGATWTTAIGAAPTHGRGFSTVNGNPTVGAGNNGFNGIITPVADAVTQTRIGVFRFPFVELTTSTVFFGTNTATATQGGSAMIRNAGSTGMEIKMETRNVSPNFTVCNDAALKAPYVAIAEVTVGATRSAFVSGFGWATQANGKALDTSRIRKVAIGNSYRAAAFDNKVEIAEFMIFNAAKTEAEIRAILKRSQQRLAPRAANFIL